VVKSKKPPPILSQLLQIIAWCIAGLGVLTCIGALIQFLRTGDNISFGAMIMAAIITLFWTAIFLGLAQVIRRLRNRREHARHCRQNGNPKSAHERDRQGAPVDREFSE
jgi:hypothetical protein